MPQTVQPNSTPEPPGGRNEAGRPYAYEYKAEVMRLLAMCNDAAVQGGPEAHKRAIMRLRGLVAGKLAFRPKLLEEFKADCWEPVPIREAVDRNTDGILQTDEYEDVLDDDSLCEWQDRIVEFMGLKGFFDYESRESTMF